MLTHVLSTDKQRQIWLWDTAQHSTAQHSTAQHSTAQHSTAQRSIAQHSTAQHGHSTWSKHYSHGLQQLMGKSCDDNTTSVSICAYVYKLDHWLGSIPNSAQAQPKEEGEGDDSQDVHVDSCSSHVVRKHVASNIQKRLQRRALNCSWNLSS